VSLVLEILAPDQVILRAQVLSVQAADASGRFGLWTGHEDFLTVLAPCLVRFRLENDKEEYAAIDGGVLLLEGGRISIVTRDAVISDQLDKVADAALAMIAARKEKEHAARSGFSELETTLVRELRKAVQRS
jgi:F-type H+-transporting ATPase subunit epsilon